MQTFTGTEAFRQRIVCATLSGKPCQFRDIRALEEAPGIQQHEASFLRLVDKISNGSRVSINETGERGTAHSQPHQAKTMPLLATTADFIIIVPTLLPLLSVQAAPRLVC